MNVEIAGFEPCEQDTTPIIVDTDDGTAVPLVLYGMEFVDDDQETGGYRVSRRHPWFSPVVFRVRPEVDTLLLTKDYEAAEGSRFRYAS